MQHFAGCFFFFFSLPNASRHNRQVNAVWIGCELETLGLKNKAGTQIGIYFLHVRRRRVVTGADRCGDPALGHEGLRSAPVDALLLVPSFNGVKNHGGSS